MPCNSLLLLLHAVVQTRSHCITADRLSRIRRVGSLWPCRRRRARIGLLKLCSTTPDLGSSGSYVLLRNAGLRFRSLFFGRDGRALLGPQCLLYLVVRTSAHGVGAELGGFRCGGYAIAISVVACDNTTICGGLD